MFESFRGNLRALSTSDEGFAHILDLEDGRSLDIVPILLGKGIGGFLLATLLSLGDALVFSDGHCSSSVELQLPLLQ